MVDERLQKYRWAARVELAPPGDVLDQVRVCREPARPDLDVREQPGVVELADAPWAQAQRSRGLATREK